MSQIQTQFTAKSSVKSVVIAAATFLTFLAPLQSAADDTEVFFGRIDQNQQIKPNVLFALDTSGSMTNTDAGSTEPRITRMKNALVDIIEGATNLNIGLMRFNGSYGGGPILYPVTDIDQEACLGGNCGSVPEINRVGSLNDDGEENLGNGDVSLDGFTLSMGSPTHLSTNQRVAFRFDNLSVPSGATITSARIEFTADKDSNVNSNFTIAAEDVDDSAPYTTADRNLSDRQSAAITVPWSPERWYDDQTYYSPDITSVVQQIVNRDGWCGGNALTILVDGDGRRDAKSSRNDTNRAPALNLTYDSTSIPADKGCSNKKVVVQIKQKNDDAEERLSNGSVELNSTDLELPRDGNREQMVGMRFQDVAIPKNAIIESASIEFEIDEYKTGSTTMDIWGEARDDSESFTTDSHDITNRPRTSATVPWVNPLEPGANQKLYSPSLTGIVQEIVNRSGWESGNALSILIRHRSGNKRRTVESFDGEPSNAPTLTVEYKTNGATRLTVRDLLIEEVENLRTQGYTPILDVMYEGAQYLRGQPVEFGTSRGKEHNGTDYRHEYHRVSHPASYDPGTLSRPAACTVSDNENPNCKLEQILDNPRYISPMNSSCQSNHLIILSDGKPNRQASVDRVKSLTGKSSCEESGNEACISELAHWLATTDHSTGLSGTQNITTYTIGFGTASGLEFLEEVSTAGLGRHFTAVSSEELQSAFNSILSDVLDTSTTFVAPGATVNQFNRLTHRNDIYFSLFRPLENPLWDGNLKKYRLLTNTDQSVDIVDANNDPAVDEASGFFSTNSKSLWSDTVDGNEVFRGGAAAEIDIDSFSTGQRKVYTYTGAADPDGVDLSADENRLHEDNTNLTKALLGIDSQNDDYRTDLIRWARGLDVLDTDNDDQVDDARMHMGDPMHSRPLIVNYNAGTDVIDSTIYVATNEGFLHAIDHEEGKEVFTFVPQELLSNLDNFFVNSSTTPHPYGLDGQQSLWHDDKNGNNLIDPDEDAFLIVGMRRGGNNYYAVNITDRSAPKLMWSIKGGAGGTDGFEELAQTWSIANVANIKYGSDTHRPVVIFGAGYDTNQDDDPLLATRPKREDNQGRGIFVVDAKTGERIWSVSPESSISNHTTLPDMRYSVPSDIRVIDVDLDGTADQMYFGDMGGQIWRLDFDYQNAGGQLIYGGVIADFSGSDADTARRFYYEPDVALISRTGQRFMSLSIGSGWRAHPLDEVVNDKFYTIRMPLTFIRPEGYGKVDSSGTTNSYSPFTESDLLNISNIPHPDEADIFAHSGWVLDLPANGEKVLGDALTVNNQIIFTTYQPDLDVGICDTAAGGGNVYVMDVFDGSPTIDFSENSEDGNRDNFIAEDRSMTLSHGGIPPEPSALITEEGVPVVAAGTQLIPEVDFYNLTRRTWWQEATSEEE